MKPLAESAPSWRSYLCRLAIKRSLGRRSATDVLQARQAMERGVRHFKVPAGVTVEPLQVAGRPAEWLLPQGARQDAALLYVHGGAYVSGSCVTHRALAARIALAAGRPLLLPDYRLAPEHPYPAGLLDVLGAYQWLQRERQIAAENIVLVGDSAGGGLLLATTLRLRDSGQPLPGGLVCMSPWTDLHLRGASVYSRHGLDPVFADTRRLQLSAASYAGAEALEHPEISPLYADLRGLPPLYVQVGDCEILLSDAEQLTLKARAAGVAVTLEVWPRMWHVWQVFGSWLPEAQRAITRIGEFVRGLDAGD